MRQLYLVVLASFLLLAQAIQAQCDPRTITTKWDAANTSNTWNWTTNFFDQVYIKNRAGTTVASPFYNPFSTFQNPNLIFLQEATIKDNLPEDGWELLVKDFGNNSNLPATAVSNPFFALYNRHTATIRAFFLVVDPLSGTNNGATMSLMFEGGVGHTESALMAHASPAMNALDKFEKSIILRNPNRYSNEMDYWLFADFPVSYDPCTCLFGSKITFTVQLIENTTASLSLKLTGSSSGTLKDIIKPSPDGVQTNTNSNSVVSWINNTTKSGVEGYKDYQKCKSSA